MGRGCVHTDVDDTHAIIRLGLLHWGLRGVDSDIGRRGRGRIVVNLLLLGWLDRALLTTARLARCVAIGGRVLADSCIVLGR